MTYRWCMDRQLYVDDFVSKENRSRHENVVFYLLHVNNIIWLYNTHRFFISFHSASTSPEYLFHCKSIVLFHGVLRPSIVCQYIISTSIDPLSEDSSLLVGDLVSEITLSDGPYYLFTLPLFIPYRPFPICVFFPYLVLFSIFVCLYIPEHPELRLTLPRCDVLK